MAPETRGKNKTAAAAKAPAKKAGTRKAAAKATNTGRRVQPARKVHPTQTLPHDEDEEGEAPPPRRATRPKASAKAPTAAASRPTRGKSAAAAPEEPEDSSEDEPVVQQVKRIGRPAPTANASRTVRPKRPVGDQGEGDDRRPAKRPRRGEAEAPPPAAIADNNDDEQEGQGVSEEELRLDDADHSADCELEDIDQLARVESGDIAFTLDEADVTLKFRLQVFEDPEHSDCRLFHRLRVFLTAADQEVREAGYIHAYRISRRNQAHRRHAENQAWIRELMPKNVNRVPEEIRETAMCLRAMFNLDGTVAVSKVRDADIRQSLANHPLLFIEMIHIRRRYQRKGLLTPVVRHWQRLLQQLPEWYAFLGNIVLVPGKPNNDRAGAVWAGKEDNEVEEVLTVAYRRQGFEVWVQGAKVGDVRIRVMGKHLEPIEEGDE